MWSDRETEHDFLGYRSYVAVLADVCLHPGLAPLTMGVFGAWGSGKSSLMRMLKNHIDAQVTEEEGRTTMTVEFNAWRYEGREEAQAALIHAILNKLQENQSLASEAKDLFDRLKKNASVLKLAKSATKSLMTMTPDFMGFIDAFKDESEAVAKTMQQFESDLSDCLTKLNVSRVVVFIDDLDRCSDAKVVETFETIKLFLNVPACTFVIGADDQRIKESVGSVYSIADEGRRKDFLEKIIQIPFSIPEQTLPDIRCFVGMLLISKHLDSDTLPGVVDGRHDLYNCEDASAYCEWVGKNGHLFSDGADIVGKDIKAILPFVEVFGRGLRGNPRQIKRFLNILLLRQRMAEANELSVDAGLIVKLCVIEYVWDDFVRDVASTLDPSTGKSQLLAELARGTEDGQADDSEMLSRWWEKSRLLDFLRTEPALDGSEDLRPYMFLAQTSLGRAEVRPLLPADERAEQLLAEIVSEDRLVSKAGAMRAAAEEPGVAAAVVRALCARLPVTKNPKVLTFVVSALEVIGQKHPAQFGNVVTALNAIEATDNDGIRLAASALLRSAKSEGVEVDRKLITRFESALTKSILPSESTTSKAKRR